MAEDFEKVDEGLEALARQDLGVAAEHVVHEPQHEGRLDVPVKPRRVRGHRRDDLLRIRPNVVLRGLEGLDLPGDGVVAAPLDGLTPQRPLLQALEPREHLVRHQHALPVGHALAHELDGVARLFRLLLCSGCLAVAAVVRLGARGLGEIDGLVKADQRLAVDVFPGAEDTVLDAVHRCETAAGGGNGA